MTARTLAPGSVTGSGTLTYPLQWKLENAKRTHDRAVVTLENSIAELAQLEAQFSNVNDDRSGILIATAKKVIKRNEIQLQLAEAKLLVAQANCDREKALDVLKAAHKSGQGIEAAEKALALAEKTKAANANHLYKLQVKHGS